MLLSPSSLKPHLDTSFDLSPNQLLTSFRILLLYIYIYICPLLYVNSLVLTVCPCRNLSLEYLDLYLIHWPVSSKPGTYEFPIKQEDFLPMDFNSVWEAMEDCQRLGLTKSIGVSNFSCKKLSDILAFAKIPPAVNQVLYYSPSL